MIENHESALLVAAAGNEPHWAEGAREILVGVIKTLQHERKTKWDWTHLKAALDLDDAALKDFACRVHPAAKRFLALDGDQNFTKNAGSYVSTLMAPINKLIEPLAAAWDSLKPQFQLSLTAWLDDPKPVCRTLILQRAPDLDALSTAWIGSAVQVIARHLVGTRRDRNPADQQAPQTLPDVWFLLDEFAQLGPIASSFLPVLEVGRSLGLRVMLGLQNFQQLSRIQGQHAPAELLQLIGTLICFRLNPGVDAKRICEERLTTAPVRTWTQNEKTGVKEPSSKEIRICLRTIFRD
jgi:type IV secretory pathway TraG/TraD family ATPase VirD4